MKSFCRTILSAVLFSVWLLAFAPSAHAQQPSEGSTSISPVDTSALKTFLSGEIAGLAQASVEGEVEEGQTVARGFYYDDTRTTSLIVIVADLAEAGIPEETTIADTADVNGYAVFVMDPKTTKEGVPERMRTEQSILSAVVQERLAVIAVATQKGSGRSNEEAMRLARRAIKEVGPERVEAFIEEEGLLAGDALEAWRQEANKQ